MRAAENRVEKREFHAFFLKEKNMLWLKQTTNEYSLACSGRKKYYSFDRNNVALVTRPFFTLRLIGNALTFDVVYTFSTQP